MLGLKDLTHNFGILETHPNIDTNQPCQTLAPSIMCSPTPKSLLEMLTYGFFCGNKKKGIYQVKREKTDENTGHYIIASSRPPERRPLERRTLAPK